MRLLEHEGKALLAAAGIAVPDGEVATTAAEARDIAERLAVVAVKAQVRSGGRGRAGGIVLASTPDDAEAAANRLLGSELLGESVQAVLVESALDIAAEAYLAVAVDTSMGVPVLLYSATGGIDIEDEPDAVFRERVDPLRGIDGASAGHVAEMIGVDPDIVRRVYGLFVAEDAVLVEINPLITTADGRVVAADAKIELDDAAAFRHEGRTGDENGDATTALEREAAAAGLRLIELGGSVAVLANGAGLTMTTMDAVVSAGGRPANFLEIGGDAYTRAVPALRLALSQPAVRSLLVNFCGAFARCDVMTAGVVEALEELQPSVPVFFTVHGTGQNEARELLRDRLGVEPYERMEDAVLAAVRAAR